MADEPSLEVCLSRPDQHRAKQDAAERTAGQRGRLDDPGACAHCQRDYLLPSHLEGKHVRCRGCSQPFEVEALAQVAVKADEDVPVLEVRHGELEPGGRQARLRLDDLLELLDRLGRLPLGEVDAAAEEVRLNVRRALLQDDVQRLHALVELVLG